MTEMMFLAVMVIALGLSVASAMIGLRALQLVALFLILATATMAGKLVSVFGFTVSVATCLYAGIFLVTDVVSEVYGKKHGLQTVLFTFFGMVLFLMIGTIVSKMTASPPTPVSDGLSALFAFLPRLMLGGTIAFAVAQTTDVLVFHWLKKLTGEKYLWLRNNGSTMVSQFIDTVIVWMIAFYGVVDNIWAIIFASYVIKLATAAIDTPFVYIAVNFGKKPSDD